MIHIHRTILAKTYKGHRHLGQIYYTYTDSGYPDIEQIDLYRIEEDEMVGPCVSRVRKDGYGEDKLTLDDRLTGIMILVDDEAIDWKM